eukprot:TRINITY_DN5411_c0_g1_i1.p1 TRINITY_DN5411_c0_g1~~TRINITY_DN5411_c0_g1_i1.p1  ORF type:complete len:231 (-),score=33.40 TRINITY_DN5411_c0_g1_i1:9-608(-)
MINNPHLQQQHRHSESHHVDSPHPQHLNRQTGDNHTVTSTNLTQAHSPLPPLPKNDGEDKLYPSITNILSEPPTPQSPSIAQIDPQPQPQTPPQLQPQQRSGYLTKRGYIINSWRNRWFNLNDGNLIYHSDVPPRGKVLGSFRVRGSLIERSNQFPFPFLFKVITTNRTYFLRASSNGEVEQWINACVSHGAICRMMQT